MTPLTPEERATLQRLADAGIERNRHRVFTPIAIDPDTLLRLLAQVRVAEALRVHCDRCGADYAATGIEAGCPCQLTELLRSAHAIAERRGADTAWQRFAASIQALGIGSVTARTYRVLPSDEEASESALATAQRDECDRLREERDAADASARQLQERVQRSVDGAVAERQKVAALRAWLTEVEMTGAECDAEGNPCDPIDPDTLLRLLAQVRVAETRWEQATKLLKRTVDELCCGNQGYSHYCGNCGRTIDRNDVIRAGVHALLPPPPARREGSEGP